ncbi:MAG: hypothetical protein M0P69_09230 [Bacteroidales bacterium]|nr:hypothetical protein [Bacteroidales bacterium]
MKYGKIVDGDITYNPADDYTELEEIGGWLDVQGADARKAFPKLKTIGGWLYTHGADTRKAFPKLTTIGGSLDVRGADTRKAFPNLKTIGRWLDVQGADARTAFPNLKTIGAWLDVQGADTRKAFPELTTIGGWLDARGADARTAFPKLTTIGRGVDVQDADRRTVFPEVTVIGGKLDVQGADRRTVFPKLKHENSDKAKQIARRNLTHSLLKSGYMLQDGILSKHIASRKLANGLIVHTGIIVGKTNKTYVIETPDGVYAHGDTVKQAREALLYKLDNTRDTTPYKAWTLDTSITKRQAIQSYMAITGACETGTRHFVETTFSDKVPARTTVQKVIEMTAGQYKSDVYKNFFTENNKQ